MSDPHPNTTNAAIRQKTIADAQTAKQAAEQAEAEAVSAQESRQRSEEAAQAAETSRNTAAEMAQEALDHAAQYANATNDLANTHRDVERMRAEVADAAQSVAQSEQSAQEVMRVKDDLVDSHDKIARLLTEQTTTTIADGYRADAKAKGWVEALHWVGIAVVIGLLAALHFWGDWGEDPSLFDRMAISLPLLLVLAIINRSLNDGRMVRHECAHAARFVTGVMGFKHEFGDQAQLDQPFNENTPIAKVIEALERNPAGRIKTGTDGLMGVLQAKLQPDK